MKSDVLNNRSIDSARISIPLSSCKVLMPELLQTAVTIRPSTGEIIKEFQTYPVDHTLNGIYTKIYIGHQFDTKLVCFTIKAKMLKHQYLTGINRTNIRQVYDYLINEVKCVYFTFETFLQGTCNDIDFKTDFEINDIEFSKFVHKQKSILHYPTPFTKYPNIGIEYAKRQTSVPSFPYVKYYSKGAELLQRSEIFKSFYLRDFNNIAMRRLEVTIKNSVHKDYILRKTGIEIGKTLEDVLTLDSLQIKKIISYMVNQHEKPEPIINRDMLVKTYQGLSTTDRLIYQLICDKIESVEDIIPLVNEYFPKHDNETDGSYSVKKSRIKKLIQKMYEIKCKAVRKKPLDLEDAF